MAGLNLVATDLDGTLLTSHSELSEENVAALTKAHEAGVELVIATGRPRRWLEVIEPLRELDPIILASNGAMVYRMQSLETLALHPIDPDLLIRRAHLIKEQVPGVKLAVEYGDSWGHEDGYTYRYEIPPQPVVNDICQLAHREPVVKLLVMHPEMESDALHEACLPSLGDELDSTFSMGASSGIIEVSAAGINKGTSLANLLNELQLDAQTVAAFGDMPNDLEMLELVGHPFRMEEAHPWLINSGFPVAGAKQNAGVGRQVLRLLGIS